MQTLKFQALLTMLLSKSNRKAQKRNCKLLIEIVQKVFLWVDRNTVKLDDKKFELIHFKSSNTSSTDTMKLSNSTILKSKLDVKWLEI